MTERILSDVAQAVLNIVPPSFEKYSDFEKAVKSIIDSSNYCPPEGMPFWWGELAKVCFIYLGNGDAAWLCLIKGIMAGEISHKLLLE